MNKRSNTTKSQSITSKTRSNTNSIGSITDQKIKDLENSLASFYAQYQSEMNEIKKKVLLLEVQQKPESLTLTDISQALINIGKEIDRVEFNYIVEAFTNNEHNRSYARSLIKRAFEMILTRYQIIPKKNRGN
ncbi:hypothetical protein [Candidatus Harpocratesius sp.]